MFFEVLSLTYHIPITIHVFTGGSRALGRMTLGAVRAIR
jgi:hypothetical protein